MNKDNSIDNNNNKKEEQSVNPIIKIESEKEIEVEIFQIEKNNSIITKGQDPSQYLFLSNNTQMLGSRELDIIADKVKTTYLPEMFFGYNRFFVLFPTKNNLILEINPIQILDETNFILREQNHINHLKEKEEKKDEKNIEKTDIINNNYYIPNDIKVQFYNTWKTMKVPDRTDVKTVTPTCDWSYSSSYMGNIQSLSSHKIFSQYCEGKYSFLNKYLKDIDLIQENSNTKKLRRELTEEGIPIERLSPENPALHYWDIPLFDDELNDNGLSKGNFRFRVMKDCFFGLLRSYLRVDNVAVRIVDTRIFHSFDSNYILRDFQVKESTYDQLKEKEFKITSNWSLSDSQSDQVSSKLDLVMNVRDKIYFD